ncbi:MAG: hypothetical protein ABSG91_01485 [Syntrophobacteraceae bacterium]|jgi:imidazolonepropionase
MMYGQMTAGSWIYIGTQGILQGTYETLAALARKHWNGTLRGRIVVSGGLGGMGGAQPLAVTMNEGVMVCVEVSSVRAVRETSEAELFSMTRRHAESALRFGTTTLEIISGYGLDTESELKMLRVIERIGRELPIDAVPTFLGAHAIPEEFAGAADRYVELIVYEMVPAVAEQAVARFCDVFCEKSVFTIEQSRRILEAGRKAGMGLKIHADEVCDLGGAALAADLRTTSAEHLLRASDENIRAMAGAGVIGILLPATAYSLQKQYAPARKMVELGLPIALATDCNPGTSYTESMPFVFGLSVTGVYKQAELVWEGRECTGV